MSAPAGDRDLTLRPTIGREDLVPCARCGKGLAHTGLPLFWRVTVERFGLDAGAVRRRGAMEQYFMPAPALADVFSTGEPLGKRIDLKAQMSFCEACAMESTCIAALAELGPNDEDDDDIEDPLAAATSREVEP